MTQWTARVENSEIEVKFDISNYHYLDEDCIQIEIPKKSYKKISNLELDEMKMQILDFDLVKESFKAIFLDGKKINDDYVNLILVGIQDG